MTTTTLSRVSTIAHRRFSCLARPLAALGLLLTTASAAHAQTGALPKTTLPQADPSRPAAQARPRPATITTYQPVGTAAQAQGQARSAAALATTTVTFANTQQGWFSPQQERNANNLNYFVGTTIRDNYRDFFTFSLAGLNLTGKQVVSATLSLVDGASSAPNSTVTYTLHDVSTPATTLGASYAAGDPVAASVFNDLGTGQSYGSFVNTATSTGRRVYTLAAPALADIATHAGQNFSVGGMLLEEQASTANYLFGYTGFDSSTGIGQQLLTLELADAPPTATVSVQYQTGDLGQPTDGQLRPFLQLVNSGATAVPYSSLTVRYWLTPENFMGQLVTPIDYAKLGTSFVSARYVQLATPRQGALGYIEYSFAAGAGNLAAGTDSGPIYGKAYKPDYSNLDETDDWSYQTSGSFTTNDHVTLYQNGTLIAGTEPPAVTSTTSLNVYSASRDASASTQFVSVQLQVRNTGNVPVNYSDVKVRYYFTRDGATTIVPELDYAKLGNGNLTLRVVNLPTAVSGADAYLEVGFSAALGVFYPRTSTDDILFKLRKDTYQALDQTNDYSFTGSTALLVNNRFPAYLNGSLVFGTPPNGAPARPLASTAAADEPLAVALTGSPNPTSDQLQLAFSLAYTQAYSLAVYDGQGRLVRQLPGGTALAGQTQQLTLPAQELAAGLYLVRLTTATDQQQLKFLKQ